MKLAAQPLSDVTVSAARTAGDADLSVSAGSLLTFTGTNWNTPQTVTKPLRDVTVTVARGLAPAWRRQVTRSPA